MKFTYSCLIAVIAMSSVSTFTQAKTRKTYISSKPRKVDVQCNDWGWTGNSYTGFEWVTYCTTISARKNGKVTDKIKVKGDCDDAASIAKYILHDADNPKFQFKGCVTKEDNHNPYSQVDIRK